MLRGLRYVSHAIECMAPDSAPTGPRLSLEHQHVADQRPVVTKAVDPCQPPEKEISLNPSPVFVVEVGKLPVVSIGTPSAISKDGPYGLRLIAREPF